MSLNQSMGISLNSMKNNQYALTVVAQNISNIHTEGYVRQRVDFQTNPSTTDNHNVISTIRGMNGASIASLTDFIDDSAFKDLVNKNADSEYYNKLADIMDELSDISDDLGDNGLNSILEDFYTASANLEKYPADISMRQQFVMAASSVAEKFNQMASRFDSVKENKVDSIQFGIQDINSLIESLATANKNYLDTNGSTAAQSDINKILKDLSNYANFQTDKNNNGTTNLYLGDVKIVEGSNVSYNLKADIDMSSDDTVKIKLVSTEDNTFVMENGVTDSFKAGSMKAYLDAVNGTGGAYSNVNDMKHALDDAASAFADAINEIQTFGHSGGDVFAAYITTDADTGDLILKRAEEKDVLFTKSDGTSTFTASNIQINADVAANPYLVSAARIDLSKYQDENGVQIEDWEKAIGNSDNAGEFTALQSKKICSYGGGVNNATLSDFLIYNAAKAGSEAAKADRQAETFQDIADSAAENYSNLVGVNLDEELADMIKYQRAYEASAKLFSVIDNLTQTIINMV